MALDPTTGGIRLEPAPDGSWYTDPAVLRREMDGVFRRTWLCAGRADRLGQPGSFLTLEIGGDSLLLVCDRQGRPRAFHNVCRHRGARLCSAPEGRLDKAIRCPYHAWTYALDGRLAAAPNLSSHDGLRRDEFGLRPVALETWRGFLFLNLAHDPEPLAAQLADMPDRARHYPLETLRVARRTVHDVEANWKILVENYQECYHCPGIHPELCDLVPLYARAEVDLPGGAVALFRDGAASFTRDGTTRRPLFPDLTEEETRRFNGEMVLPNMFMNLLPDYVLTRTLWPLGPGRTRFLSEWLFDPATMERDDFDPRDAYEFADLVALQDWRICEEVQRGVASGGYGGGVYTPGESAARDVTRWVRQRIEAV
jgi:phenylpropionate dioxygenase-like ring-hydroxylating dioxygenase large terminal subunit